MNAQQAIGAANTLTALLGKVSPCYAVSPFPAEDLYVTLGSAGIGIQVTRHPSQSNDEARTSTVRAIAAHLDSVEPEKHSPAFDGFSTHYSISGTFRGQSVEVYTVVRVEVPA